MQPDDVERDIFVRWAREVQKRGWCAVWRLEVQSAVPGIGMSSSPSLLASIMSIFALFGGMLLKNKGKWSFPPPYSTKTVGLNIVACRL